jgi:alpha-galactosidase
MPGLPPLLTAAPTAPAPAAAAPAAAPVAARRAGRPLALSAAFGAADCTNCSGPIPVTTSPGTFFSGLRGHGGEAFVKHIADHMHTVKYKTSGSPKTLQELGFRYVNMDASWDTPNRSSTGQLVPDPALWPSGIDHTVAYVHSLDMGFGLYGDRGTMDCARNPGAQGHEEQDGKWFGEHKIDWCACCLTACPPDLPATPPPRLPAYLGACLTRYKEDACYATGDQTIALAEYGKMRDALNASGYPVWFALCGWEPFYAPHGKGLANSARIGPDTGTGWTAIMKNLENALPVQQYIGTTAHGGYWNDGSLMLTPGMGCSNPANCMSDERFKSMFALWTILSFNILLVGDFAKLNEFVMETWTNDWAIAINQVRRCCRYVICQLTNGSL